jgi:hypothetical protein
MEMKKEMMLNAIQLGLNMGAEGCIAMLSREELEILANAGNKKVAKEEETEVIVQVYVDMIDELIEKLAVLGYQIIINGESHANYDGFEIDHKNQVVDMLTW